jgi:nitrate/TMAO reductase-like tetraheme cytochrome c subunit
LFSFESGGIREIHEEDFIIPVCGIIIGLAISFLAAEMIERTSGKAFFYSYHSMQGVARAYEEDGGIEFAGFKARCEDCHLRHDSMFDLPNDEGI